MEMLRKGNKHTCSNCEARFYDLLKASATCPKCGTVDQTEIGRLADLEAAADATPNDPEDTEDDLLEINLEIEGDEDEDEDDEGDDEDSLMEDTSDLSHVEDDVSEVLDHMESSSPVDQ